MDIDALIERFNKLKQRRARVAGLDPADVQFTVTVSPTEAGANVTVYISPIDPNDIELARHMAESIKDSLDTRLPNFIPNVIERLQRRTDTAVFTIAKQIQADVDQAKTDIDAIVTELEPERP